MKSKHIRKISMYQSVIAVMQKQASKLSKIKEFNGAYEQLISLNNKLLELKSDFEKDLKSEKMGRNQARENVLKVVTPIANILQIYALDFKDKALAKKVRFSKKVLSKAKDSVVIKKSEAVWKQVRQIYERSLYEHGPSAKQKAAANISSYGINSQMIDELELSSKQLMESILKLKNALAYKEKCAEKIKSKIGTIDTLLKKKIDKFMTIFETTEQKFFNDYKSSRVVEKKQKKEKKAIEKKESEAVKVEQKVAVTEKKEENLQAKKPVNKRTSTAVKKTNARPVRKKPTTSTTKKTSSTTSTKTNTQKPIIEEKKPES